MSPAAIAILILSLATVGEEVARRVQLRHAAQDLEAVEAQAAQERQVQQEHAEDLQAQLGELRARVTAESLTAALGPELTDAQGRAALVAALPRAELTRALISQASPQYLAALEWSHACEGIAATGDSARLGCGPSGPMAAALKAAIEALPSTPTISLDETTPPTTTEVP